MSGTRTACWILLLVLGLLCGCGATDDGVVQPYSPDANGAIAGQAVLGAQESATYIRELAASDDGAFFFFGLLDGRGCVGRVERNGSLLWQRDPQFFVKQMRLFETSLGAGGYALVAVGDSPGGADAGQGYGIIEIFDRDGAAIAGRQVEEPQYNIRLDGVRLVSDAPGEQVFFLSGGAERDEILYPFCALFEVRSDSAVSFVREKVFVEYPGKYFQGAAWNADGSAPLYFVSSMSEWSECFYWGFPGTSGCWDDMIVCLDDTFGVLWERAVTPIDAERADIYAMEYSDGALYAVGQAEVRKKNDQRWNAGLVASIAETGDLNWSRAVVLSTYEDCYYDMEIEQGTLYAAGEYASFRRKATNRVYGYALLSRFDLPSGEAEGHGAFGNIRCSSGFRAVSIDGDAAVCGGWTNYFIAGYRFQGYFVDVDIPSLPLGLDVPPADGDLLGEAVPPSAHCEQ